MTLIVLSPAKSLDMDSNWKAPRPTQPRLLDGAAQLVQQLRGLSVSDLRGLMKLSEKLAALNVERFQDWTPELNKDNAKPAVLAFTGDVYQGLDAGSFDNDGLKFLNSQCRILSGLYGVLRPLDLMKAYRLEMGTRLDNERGATLYDFWSQSVTKLINGDIQSGNHDALVNLASNEYFKCIDVKALKVPVITPVFKEERDGKLKIISFNAKRARGQMCRYATERKIDRANDLKRFAVDGYRYDKALSSETEWLFVR